MIWDLSEGSACDSLVVPSYASHLHLRQICFSVSKKPKLLRNARCSTHLCFNVDLLLQNKTSSLHVKDNLVERLQPSRFYIAKHKCSRSQFITSTFVKNQGPKQKFVSTATHSPLEGVNFSTIFMHWILSRSLRWHGLSLRVERHLFPWLTIEMTFSIDILILDNLYCKITYQHTHPRSQMFFHLNASSYPIFMACRLGSHILNEMVNRGFLPQGCINH